MRAIGYHIAPMADPGATWLARVAAAVGPAHVLTAPADVEPYVTDWRGRFHGAARAVVEARSMRCTAVPSRVRERRSKWSA